jgi:organic radical activating enzyme
MQFLKSHLDSISPSFCAAKWQQVTLHLHNGRTHSCHHPPTHEIPVEEIRIDVSALHNTKHKKEQRKLMLEGKRPAECQYCWNVEDLGGYKQGEFFSDRISKSSQAWARPHIDAISTQPWDKSVNPSYVEVSFSNLCNFKCSYCSPVYSSKWTEEIEKHGPYNTSGQFNNLEHPRKIKEMPIHHREYNPYVEAFWKWWPDLVKDLKVFRITGGEPLLSDDTYKVIDYLIDNPQPELEFSVNTNGCIPDKLFNKFITGMKQLLDEGKIKNAIVFTSIDGWGEQAEYGRNGLNFNQWKLNIIRILEELPSAVVSVMCTTNIFSITTLGELMEFIYDTKIKYRSENRKVAISIDTSILRFPTHQNISILTPDLKLKFDSVLSYMVSKQEGNGINDYYHGFFEFEINKLKRLIEFMKTGPHPGDNINLLTSRKDFYIFVNEHDKRRGTNFLKTFPELTDFYRICEMQPE